MDLNIANIKSVVLSKTYATFETQFMTKLSNTKDQLKKSVAYI